MTAYSGSTGGTLWTKRGAVPEGTDPAAGLVYLTLPGGALAGVDPSTGTVRASVPASRGHGRGGLYVVRDGVALGLNSGANGTAWGYNMAKGRSRGPRPPCRGRTSSPTCPGLAAAPRLSGDMVVVTACPRLAASPGMCADPELVAFNL